MSAKVPDYLASPDATLSDVHAKWRHGRAPDYSKAREAYAAGKTSNHVAGSLPQLVENLVKNWEVEASHKLALRDWRTIDHKEYAFGVNNGPKSGGEHMLRVGTYNALLAANELYDPAHMSFGDSHKAFKRMMPTFAWEVLEVYSGPPTVAFRWRHWGKMEGDYVGFNGKGEKITVKAHGGPIEVFGVTVATVNDQVQLQTVDTYYDPAQLFRQVAPKGLQDADKTEEQVDSKQADKQSGWKEVEEALNNAVTKTIQNSAKKAAQETGQGEKTKGHVPSGVEQADGATMAAAGGCPFMHG